jgi:hypothetical protein
MSWTLTSHAKLVAAGFLFRKRVACRRCGKEVALYKRPGPEGSVMAIDLQGYVPHTRMCAGVRKPPATASGNLFEEPSS